MEICFVPDNDYGRFLRQAGWAHSHTGEVVDLEGRVLGRHEGIEFYTVGQRKGLGIASRQPLYVVALDPARNRVVLGDDRALHRDVFRVEHCNWILGEAPVQPLEVLAQIRSRHTATPATVTPLGPGTAQVQLHTPQRAVTPGQACVFYQGDLVLGGGWITRG
jgi:tRNA-specific 2-thiouridylase